MGALHSFLGVEARPAGIFLSQHKEIRELRTLLTGYKEVSTSLPDLCKHLSSGLVIHDGPANATEFVIYDGPANATAFSSTIGALQYLYITRPDIAYAVKKRSPFMHQLSQQHWAKRLLRYFKWDFSLSWLISQALLLFVHAYPHADWVGNRPYFYNGFYCFSAMLFPRVIASSNQLPDHRRKLSTVL